MRSRGRDQQRALARGKKRGGGDARRRWGRERHEGERERREERRPRGSEAVSDLTTQGPSKHRGRRGRHKKPRCDVRPTFAHFLLCASARALHLAAVARSLSPPSRRRRVAVAPRRHHAAVTPPTSDETIGRADRSIARSASCCVTSPLSPSFLFFSVLAPPPPPRSAASAAASRPRASSRSAASPPSVSARSSVTPWAKEGSSAVAVPRTSRATAGVQTGGATGRERSEGSSIDSRA